MNTFTKLFYKILLAHICGSSLVFAGGWDSNLNSIPPQSSSIRNKIIETTLTVFCLDSSKTKDLSTLGHYLSQQTGNDVTINDIMNYKDNLTENIIRPEVSACLAEIIFENQK